MQIEINNEEDFDKQFHLLPFQDKLRICVWMMFKRTYMKMLAFEWNRGKHLKAAFEDVCNQIKPK